MLGTFWQTWANNIHALPGTINHEIKGQHIVLSYKRIRKLFFQEAFPFTSFIFGKG